MSIIKSFAVGNGDMFYIRHSSSNFTIIDCCLNDDRRDEITAELKEQAKGKEITRFISTHPDEDHIHGLEYLNKEMPILNFYCVKNNVGKDDETDSFKKYQELRNDTNKVFYLEKGCTRKYMNESSPEIKQAGINILWPETKNQHYKDALKHAEETGEPNNISPIIEYSLKGGVTALWMGDLETEMMERIKDDVKFPKVDILFASHHGRKSGTIISDWLKEMEPKIIVIGEAPSGHLNYYPDYETITQNKAKDITFHCDTGTVHITATNYDKTFNTHDQ